MIKTADSFCRHRIQNKVVIKCSVLNTCTEKKAVAPVFIHLFLVASAACFCVMLLFSGCASGKYPKPHKRAPVGGWHKKFDSNPGGYHTGGGKETPF